MKLREINKKEFFDFCKNSSTNNFFQTKEYATFARIMGWHTYFLGIDQNGKIRAVTLLLARKVKIGKFKIFYAPRGYIINFKDLELLRFFTKEIEKFIIDKKGIFLRIDPYFQLKQLDSNGEYVTGGFNNEKVITILQELGYQKNQNVNTYTNPKFCYQLYLDNDQNVLDNCSENHKLIIKMNQKRGIKTIEALPEQLTLVEKIIKNSKSKINFINNFKYFDDFYQIMKNSNMIKINLVEMDIDLYKKNLINEKEQIDSGIIDVFNFKDINNEIEDANNLEYEYGHKVIMGCNISIYYGNEVTTICTAINDKFVNYNPIYTLAYDTISNAKNNNFSKYNFYGINPDFTEKNKLYQFYKGFGGEVVELIDEYDLVLNKFLYKRYCNYASKHNLKITDFKRHLL